MSQCIAYPTKRHSLRVLETAFPSSDADTREDYAYLVSQRRMTIDEAVKRVGAATSTARNRAAVTEKTLGRCAQPSSVSKGLADIEKRSGATPSSTVEGNATPPRSSPSSLPPGRLHGRSGLEDGESEDDKSMVHLRASQPLSPATAAGVDAVSLKDAETVRTFSTSIGPSKRVFAPSRKGENGLHCIQGAPAPAIAAEGRGEAPHCSGEASLTTPVRYNSRREHRAWASEAAEIPSSSQLPEPYLRKRHSESEGKVLQPVSLQSSSSSRKDRKEWQREVNPFDMRSPTESSSNWDSATARGSTPGSTLPVLPDTALSARQRCGREVGVPKYLHVLSSGIPAACKRVTPSPSSVKATMTHRQYRTDEEGVVVGESGRDASAVGVENAECGKAGEEPILSDLKRVTAEERKVFAEKQASMMDYEYGDDPYRFDECLSRYGKGQVLLFVTSMTGDRAARDQCRLMENLLHLKLVPHHKIDIADNPFFQQRVRALYTAAAHLRTTPSMPLLFVDTTLIGDFDTVQDLEDGGELDATMLEAGCRVLRLRVVQAYARKKAGLAALPLCMGREPLPRPQQREDRSRRRAPSPVPRSSTPPSSAEIVALPSIVTELASLSTIASSQRRLSLSPRMPLSSRLPPSPSPPAAV